MPDSAPTPLPVPSAPVPTLGKLSFWRRFHVRMSSLYGGVVFFVLTLMGCTFYFIGVEYQMGALRSRLRTAAVTLSHQIRPDAVLALNAAADRAKPEYVNLFRLFSDVGAEEPQFVSIYILRSTATGSSQSTASRWREHAARSGRAW